MSLYAYVPAYIDNSLTIVDVTNPAAPAFKSNVMGVGLPNFLGGIFDVAVVGNFAYCTCGYGGGGGDYNLTIIDISNPTAPSFVSTLPIGGDQDIRFIFVSGNYAYVTYSYGGTGALPGLSIIDISNPLAPSVVGSMTYIQMGLTGAIIGRPMKQGNYLYIPTFAGGATANDSLIIIDVSNPLAPALTGKLDSTGTADLGNTWGYVSGNYYYYTAVTTTKLSIIDVSNPALPTLKSSLSNALFAGNFGTWKEDNYCYVGAAAGFVVVDVSDVTNPFVAGNVAVSLSAYGVYKSGNFVYTADMSTNKVIIIDVSNPAGPVVAGSLSGAGLPNYLGAASVFILEGSWVPPVPPAVPSMCIDFKGLLDCIGWRF